MLVHRLSSQSGSLRIYDIGKIVALVIWMAIDPIVNHQSVALYKPTKDRRLLEHIDIVMGADHAKKKSAKSIDIVMP
jgi:hypothetical protein